MRTLKQIVAVVALSVVLPGVLSAVELDTASPPNVLFIAVDDLRPQLGCYGQPQIVSPNIDRLASGGTLFERAFCMVPTCGASRASLMTGIRPSANRFVTFQTRADRDAPGIKTLNTHFKEHGYRTVSNGKVFHVPADNVDGWTEAPWRPDRSTTYVLPESQPSADQKKAGKRGRPYESADVPDDTYADGQLADKAIADLGRLAELDAPFFLAVGFFKPHLPFVAPKKYWDLYAHDEIHLPDNYFRPANAPEESIHTFGELRAYAEVPNEGPVSDELARTLIHGYYACVSYTDAQIGRLLDELDRLGLTENTVVILWGDHGWQLGEHTMWCKHCTFETSMRTPMIVRAPGVAGGQRTRGMTEYIDIYPSLCELAGLPLPEHLEGTSFVPLLRDPRGKGKAWTAGRFRLGDTIRTDRYRYTEYHSDGGKFLARMLYDHQSDPDENVNIAELPENAAIVEEFGKQMKEHLARLPR